MWGRPAPPPPPSADVPFTALVTTAILLLCAGGCVWITVRSRPVGTRAPLSVAEFFGMCASGDLAGVQAALNGSYNSKPSNTGGGRRPYALALAINVVAVAIDGRFDSEDLFDSEGQMTKLPWPTLLSPAGFAFAKAAIVVEPDPDADHEVRREAHEDGVAIIVGCPGLASQRLADAQRPAARAALHHAFQHVRDLVSDDRVQDLLTDFGQLRRLLTVPFFGLAAFASPLIVTEQRPAMAVLNAVQQRGRDLLPAIDEACIPARHVDQVGIACAERHCGIRRKVFIDAHAHRKVADGFHPDVLCDTCCDLIQRFLQIRLNEPKATPFHSNPLIPLNALNLSIRILDSRWAH